MAQQFLLYVGNAYLVVFIIAVGLALWLPKTTSTKLLAGVSTAIVLGLPIISALIAVRKQERIAEVQQQRTDVAYARFQERCKTAGTKIVRTVDDVDGVLLVKLRPASTLDDHANPMWPGAAMALEASGESYIRTFISRTWDAQYYDESTRGFRYFDRPRLRPRYRYVEAMDATDQKRYRYSLKREPNDESANGVPNKLPQYLREEASGPAPRYAVDFEDIVDSEDRKVWIAGTVLRVIDQQTGEVIAEQTRFLMDGGQGAIGGNRFPWGHAASSALKCPLKEPQGGNDTQTRDFVNQVLKPTQRD